MSSVRTALICGLILFFLVMPVIASAAVDIYFLRHANVDFSDPDKPLIEKGRQRAKVLAQYLDAIKVTHIFVTNYYRTYDTARPLAEAKGIEVVQIPKIGSYINGMEVTNRSRGNTAIAPMLKALKSLPDGSIAVVIANSGNLFPIMSQYGVTQLPCNSKKCFPKKEFNNIWIVTSNNGAVTLQTQKYDN
jgi:hypothetical protein